MTKTLVQAIAQPQNEIPIHLCKEQVDWPIFSLKNSVVLIDKAVSKTHFHKSITENSHTIVIESSEYTKSTEHREQFVAQNEQLFNKMDALIVVGGGTIINFGTALAATLCELKLGKLPSKNCIHRPSFKFILIPSNVLAMADVAYGSLGLLNKGTIKNGYRVIYDPDIIILDIRYLRLLSVSIIKQGLAECLKHALIQDSGENDNAPRFFDCINLLKSSNPDIELVFTCIRHTIRAKASIVCAINNGNESAAHLLSYGHVDAEPRESASSFQLSHGDAVLFGLAIELALTGPEHAFQALRSILPTTSLARLANQINFSKETMLKAYRESAKPRFRSGKDDYFIIILPQVGYFAKIDAQPVNVEMRAYPFDTLYKTADTILKELLQLTIYQKVVLFKENIEQKHEIIKPLGSKLLSKL